MVKDKSADLELLDQGKQTKLARILEWFGPPTFRIKVGPAISSDKSMMEMRDRGDVPGITGEGACKEAACIIDKMGDDHFNDLQGKFCGGRRACDGNLQ